MTELKLGKLPDRTPVKLTIIIPPALNRALQTYAELYREAYGQAEPVTELIPYILETFLAGDRTYAQALRGRGVDDMPGQNTKAPRRKRQEPRPEQSSSDV